MDKEYAKFLLKKTTQDYNLIAEEYARTREFNWDIELLSQYVFAGEKVLDLGCGNGRLLKVLKALKIDYIGVDSSEKLIAIAKENHPQYKFQVADSLNLPFPDNYFDKVFNIRTFHHIPSEELQLQSLREIRRVLKPEGSLILTVWDLWRRRKIWKILFKYIFLKLIGKSKLGFSDIFYPWKSPTGKILAQRYYHLFTKKELKKLAKKADFKVKEIWNKKGKRQYPDIYLVVEK